MLPEQLAACCESLAPLLAERGLDLRPPLAMIAFSGRQRGRVLNFLVFDSSRSSPVLFLKTSLAGEDCLLEREHGALMHLARLSDVPGVPAPIALTSWGERSVLVQTGVAGRPLTALLRGRRGTRRAAVRSGLLAVTTWLERFQLATLSSERTVPAHDLLNRYAERLRDEGLLTVGRGRHLDHLGALADRFAATALPMTGVHGDLWPGNILVDRGRARVVDWQHFNTVGLPYADLCFFLLMYTQAIPRRGWSWLSVEQAFRRCFITPSWYSSLIRETAGKHLSSLGWPQGGVELIFFLYLLERAEPEQEVDDAVGPRGLDWWRLALTAAEAWTPTLEPSWWNRHR